MTVPEDRRTEPVSTARTVTGDELRFLSYLTEEAVEQLYLCEDLDQTADLVGFAENERDGFRSQTVYSDTQLGDYEFTIRVFEDGHPTRVIEGDHGVWVTTDSMRIDRFEETASALSETPRSFTA